MSVEVAEREINNALTPSGTANTKLVEAELRLLPFEGRSFTTVAGAQSEISKLSALYTKSNIDSGEREAAEDAMRRLIGQLEQDEEDDDLDDFKAKPAATAVAANDDAKNDITASKAEVTGPQAKLTPDSRVDLLLHMAENSPVPAIRFDAIEAAGRRIEKRGATEAQMGTLILITNRTRDDDVKQSANEIIGKSMRNFHHPEASAPKPGGRVLTEGDGN